MFRSIIDFFRDDAEQTEEGRNPDDSGKQLVCDSCQGVHKARWIGGDRPWKCSYCEVTYERFYPDREGVI